MCNKALSTKILSSRFDDIDSQINEIFKRLAYIKGEGEARTDTGDIKWIQISIGLGK